MDLCRVFSSPGPVVGEVVSHVQPVGVGVASSSAPDTPSGPEWSEAATEGLQ